MIISTVQTFAQENNTELILERIAGLLMSSNHEQAIALFNNIAQPDRDSSHISLIEASILSSMGRFAEARRIVERLTSSEPNNIDALFILATIEDLEGRTRQQQQVLERILSIDPNNSPALIALGNLHLRNRNARGAATNFHRVIQSDPNNAEALLGMGRVFRVNRELEEAELYFNRAVELYPDMAEARVERAQFNKGRGFLFLALEDLEHARSVDPYDYWIAIDLGTLLVEMNRRSQALEEFNRAISLDPDIFLAYAYSAPLKDEFNDPEGALRDYTVLARLRPDYYFSLEGVGLHQMRLGNWEAARDAFMEAYRQAQDEYLYALFAAIAWMRMGDITSPRNYLFQAQARVPRDTIEWHMFRLFHDLTSRNFGAETDLLLRIEREEDEVLKARMTFFMGQYYDVRGNTTAANRQYLRVHELNVRAIPEWRLNDWILVSRGIRPF
ncbi:MAG: tetratricopeptide repeat protein [Treponema sp.]|nr:tetratricopeptide repeat protein [Treponema sp.]